jgi:hypothetical protein
MHRNPLKSLSVTLSLFRVDGLKAIMLAFEGKLIRAPRKQAINQPYRLGRDRSENAI